MSYDLMHYIPAATAAAILTGSFLVIRWYERRRQRGPGDGYTLASEADHDRFRVIHADVVRRLEAAGYAEHIVHREWDSRLWVYDRDRLPAAQGGGLGWWTTPTRAVMVARGQVANTRLLEHEAAHDITDRTDHRGPWFAGSKPWVTV
jgi:hypothetical protein